MLRKQLSKTPEETRKTTERENTDDLEVQDESPLRRTLGIICAMSSCIFFALSSLLVKLLREIPPPEVVFFRNMVQVIFVLPPLIYNKIPIVGNTKRLPFLCVRGIAGTLALCCQFYTLSSTWPSQMRLLSCFPLLYSREFWHIFFLVKLGDGSMQWRLYSVLPALSS